VLEPILPDDAGGVPTPPQDAKSLDIEVRHSRFMDLVTLLVLPVWIFLALGGVMTALPIIAVMVLAIASIAGTAWQFVKRTTITESEGVLRSEVTPGERSNVEIPVDAITGIHIKPHFNLARGKYDLMIFATTKDDQKVTLARGLASRKYAESVHAQLEAELDITKTPPPPRTSAEAELRDAIATPDDFPVIETPSRLTEE